MRAANTTSKPPESMARPSLCAALGSVRPPAEGYYLAWNSRRHMWEPKWWNESEQAWNEIPRDRGTIWTHWLPMPPSPNNQAHA